MRIFAAKRQAGQVSMEYAIIFTVFLAAIFASGIIDRTRGGFGIYLAKATTAMTVIREGQETTTEPRDKAGGGELPAMPGQEEGDENSGHNAMVQMKATVGARLEETQKRYDKNKARYDAIKSIPFIGVFMPEYEETKEGKRLLGMIASYNEALGVSKEYLEE